MAVIDVVTKYYKQFDADFNLDVPAEGYGGWDKTKLPFNTDKSALVVMHAWDCGTREEYPGWHRMVEYIPRSYEICEKVLPDILKTAREKGLKVVHVVSGDDYSKNHPGYKEVLEICPDEVSNTESIDGDDVTERLRAFRTENVSPGKHNIDDIKRGRKKIDFAKGAEPVGNEPICKDSRQLFAWCKNHEVNHLVYTGFAIDGCLLVSPGGMIDMSRKGIMCSAIEEAVTAIENKETAREETAKKIALWRVALLFGFVYEKKDFVNALKDME